MDPIEIKILLQSKKIAERKLAVKVATKDNIWESGDAVFVLLLSELETKKSWEFIVEIINCLSALKYKPAIETLKKICDINEEHDMITTSAATALCIINRSNSQDVKTELALLNFGKFSVVNGTLKALSIEKIVPNENDKLKILNQISSFEPKKEKGYSDVRMGLASACAGWLNMLEAKSFLEDCMKSEYSPLIKVAQNSIKGKYSAL